MQKYNKLTINVVHPYRPIVIGQSKMQRFNYRGVLHIPVAARPVFNGESSFGANWQISLTPHPHHSVQTFRGVHRFRHSPVSPPFGGSM